MKTKKINKERLDKISIELKSENEKFEINVKTANQSARSCIKNDLGSKAEQMFLKASKSLLEQYLSRYKLSLYSIEIPKEMVIDNLALYGVYACFDSRNKIAKKLNDEVKSKHLYDSDLLDGRTSKYSFSSQGCHDDETNLWLANTFLPAYSEIFTGTFADIKRYKLFLEETRTTQKKEKIAARKAYLAKIVSGGIHPKNFSDLKDAFNKHQFDHKTLFYPNDTKPYDNAYFVGFVNAGEPKASLFQLKVDTPYGVKYLLVHNKGKAKFYKSIYGYVEVWGKYIGTHKSKSRSGKVEYTPIVEASYINY